MRCKKIFGEANEPTIEEIAYAHGEACSIIFGKKPYLLNSDTGEVQMMATKVTGIDETLAERGNRYGVFAEHARITQNIKRAMIDTPNWTSLSDDKKEALEMTAHKIGRILNGDPEYKDSWHDVIGYVKLVENTLRD